jgi:hypothetical protein
MPMVLRCSRQGPADQMWPRALQVLSRRFLHANSAQIDYLARWRGRLRPSLLPGAWTLISCHSLRSTAWASLMLWSC